MNDIADASEELRRLYAKIDAQIEQDKKRAATRPGDRRKAHQPVEHDRRSGQDRRTFKR